MLGGTFRDFKLFQKRNIGLDLLLIFDVVVDFEKLASNFFNPELLKSICTQSFMDSRNSCKMQLIWFSFILALDFG